MGHLVSRYLCCEMEEPLTNQEANLQILVVGDQKVGKSTLVNNYVSDQEKVEFETISELIRIVNAVQFVQDPNTSQFTTARVTIVDIEGASDQNNVKLRNAYYGTSQIVLVLFDIGDNMSLYNAFNKWQKEIDQATERVAIDNLANVQLVLVGVNPEAREKFTVLTEDKFPVNRATEIMPLLSKSASVNQKSAERVATEMKYRKSTRETKYAEVRTTKKDIQRFFTSLVEDYVYPRDE